MPCSCSAGAISVPTEPVTSLATLLNRRRVTRRMVSPGTLASLRRSLWYAAGSSVSRGSGADCGAARITLSTCSSSSPVAAANALAVASGSRSSPGRTSASQAADGRISEPPPASSSAARFCIRVTTAIRSPWRSPGLMTAGLHTTFQRTGDLAQREMALVIPGRPILAQVHGGVEIGRRDAGMLADRPHRQVVGRRAQLLVGGAQRGGHRAGRPGGQRGRLLVLALRPGQQEVLRGRLGGWIPADDAGRRCRPTRRAHASPAAPSFSCRDLERRPLTTPPAPPLGGACPPTAGCGSRLTETKGVTGLRAAACAPRLR